MAKNNKTCFFYVLNSDKTWLFDKSEHVQGPIYIIKDYKFNTENIDCLISEQTYFHQLQTFRKFKSSLLRKFFMDAFYTQNFTSVFNSLC